MANVIINDTNLTNIANAIREKNGETTKYKPSEMASAILAIEGSGVDTGDIPAEAFKNTIGGHANAYRFYGNHYNWFIELFGSQINTLYVDEYMFKNNTDIETIPFPITFNAFYGGGSIDYAFENCQSLKEITNVVLDENSYTDYNEASMTMSHLFADCWKLKTLPEELFGSGIKARTGNLTGERDCMFYKCYSLRKLPNLENVVNKEAGYYSLFSRLAWGAVSLDEAINLPVSEVSPALSTSFVHCHRLKNMTFETNANGTPKTANWSGVTLDLSNAVGWANNTSYLTSSMYGDFSGPYVSGNNTYNTYKDTEDWYTNKVEYSRYNKTSALKTINSLPDCSASGSNTIKFFGEAGSSTGVGAINTMTEEEIAVAVAKGWSVAYTDYLMYSVI